MRALITGASSGIGLALAEALGREGTSLVGLDRDPVVDGRDFRSLGPSAELVTLDLTDEEALREFAAADTEFDLVVHSAGISSVGRFPEGDPAEVQRVLDVNFRAPLQLTGALLARGAIRDGGSLVFVSSLSRFVGYPGAAVYTATKDGLASYARSLAVALAPRSIHVLTVYPGPTRTPHARLYSPDNTRESRRMPAERVATEVLRAVRRRQRVLVPGWGNKVMAALGFLCPALTERFMRQAILAKLEPSEVLSSGR